MEPPVKVSGAGHSDYVRDAKVQALECIPPVTLDDVVLGQYVGDDSHEGYLDGKRKKWGPPAYVLCAASFL